jgi:hypothetical protein
MRRPTFGRFVLPSVCLAGIAAGCGSSIGAGWVREGYDRVQPHPVVPLAGNYFVQPRTYSGEGQRPRTVLRLYHKPAGASEPVEIPFPDTYSLHPAISPRFISPDGHKVMTPGLPVFARGRPLLWDFVIGGKFGPHFEADPKSDRKPEFLLTSLAPMWASNSNWFAVETFERDGAGTVADVVFFHHLGGARMEVFAVSQIMGEGSWHFGGWSPSGKKLAVFEGFPNEEYLVGPKDVHHRILDRFGNPVARAVRLFEVTLYPEVGKKLLATRVGGWVRPGPFRPDENFFYYTWTADEQLKLEPGAKPAEGG